MTGWGRIAGTGLLALLFTVPLRAQTVVVDASAEMVQGLIVPADPNQAKLFATSARDAAVLLPAGAAGTVAPWLPGTNVPGGLFPAGPVDQPPSRLSAEVGFNYLRPNWSNTNFRALFPRDLAK